VAALRETLKRPLSAKELAVFVAGALLLVAAGYFAYQLAEPWIMGARARALLPKVCAGVREQRARLVSALEAYKARFGSYPPDHLLSRQLPLVDPVTNTLAYELAGVVYNPTNHMLQLGSLEPAEAVYVSNFFQAQGFRNIAPAAGQVQHFLPADQLTVGQLHDDPDVYALRFDPVLEDVNPDVLALLEFSTWRYVSSYPTNNPGQFDLWIDIRAGDKRLTLGNWPAVQ
jgi:hypothetical protein